MMRDLILMGLFLGSFLAALVIVSLGLWLVFNQVACSLSGGTPRGLFCVPGGEVIW